MTRGDPRTERTNPVHEGEARSAEGRAPGELLRVAQRAGGAAPSSNEDSGIIDIRGLMASAKDKSDRRDRAARAAELTPLPVVRALSVYPLGDPAASQGSEPPTPMAPPPPRRSASRFGLLLGLSVMLLAGGATAVLLSRTGRESARAAPPKSLAAPSFVAAGVSDVQGTPEALPAPAPPTDITAPAESALPAESASAAPDRAAPPSTRPVAKKAVAAAAPKPAASAPAKTPIPADTCKGNLLCAMKRATAGH